MKRSPVDIMKILIQAGIIVSLIFGASISSAQFSSRGNSAREDSAFLNPSSSDEFSPFYEELKRTDRNPNVEARGQKIDLLIHPTRPLTSEGSYDVKVAWPRVSGAASYIFKIKREEPFPYVRTYVVPRNRQYLRILAGRIYQWIVIPLDANRRPIAKPEPPKSLMVVYPEADSSLAGSPPAD